MECFQSSVLIVLQYILKNIIKENNVNKKEKKTMKCKKKKKKKIIIIIPVSLNAGPRGLKARYVSNTLPKMTWFCFYNCIYDNNRYSIMT